MERTIPKHQGISRKWYLVLVILVTYLACHDWSPGIPEKGHETLRKEILAGYETNRGLFQSLAAEVSKFKIIRSIDFKSGRSGKQGIEVYCNSIDRDSAGYTVKIQSLSDPMFKKVLSDEGISLRAIESIERNLSQLDCHSFFSMSQSEVSVEFQYDSWNGSNFYYCKVFDKAFDLEQQLFFDKHLVHSSMFPSPQGGILDSNVIWYYKDNGFSI